MRIDIIGDIHGQLDALRALGTSLGYAVDSGWDHPDGRLLLFVGDLVDRGPASLEVSELVMELAQRRRALCLLGNHEYNLAGYVRGFVKAKRSNAATIEDLSIRPGRWAPVLRFFEALPVAIELDDLRVIHAAWHRDCFERVGAVLGRGSKVTAIDALAELERCVVLPSPLRDGRPHPDLPARGVPPAKDAAHEILIKGYEAPTSSPFRDNDGVERRLVRVCFWNPDVPGGKRDVPDDKTLVFGHYWSVPPASHDIPFAPPYPSGHPELRKWQAANVLAVPASGCVPVPAHVRFVCVDYNGVVRAGGPACVGAYRYPEREVAWATAPSTASGPDMDTSDD